MAAATRNKTVINGVMIAPTFPQALDEQERGSLPDSIAFLWLTNVAPDSRDLITTPFRAP